MTQTANNYGTVLFELGITKEIVEKTKEIFKAVVLDNMTYQQVGERFGITVNTVKTMYYRALKQEIHHFLKELCDHEHMDVIEDVFAAYQNCYDEKNGILRAKMQCAEVPDETQLAQIRNYLAGKYQKTQVELEFEKKPELIAGFVLRVGDIEEDFSIRGRLDRLQQKLTWR